MELDDSGGSGGGIDTVGSLSFGCLGGGKLFVSFRGGVRNGAVRFDYVGGLLLDCTRFYSEMGCLRGWD